MSGPTKFRSCPIHIRSFSDKSRPVIVYPIIIQPRPIRIPNLQLSPHKRNPNSYSDPERRRIYAGQFNPIGWWIGSGCRSVQVPNPWCSLIKITIAVSRPFASIHIDKGTTKLVGMGGGGTAPLEQKWSNSDARTSEANIISARSLFQFLALVTHFYATNTKYRFYYFEAFDENASSPPAPLP